MLNKNAYVFLIATCGSTPGNAILSIKERLEHNGASVAYSRIVSMPDCSAPAMNNDPRETAGNPKLQEAYELGKNC